jgi:hypothetical protein
MYSLQNSIQKYNVPPPRDQVCIGSALNGALDSTSRTTKCTAADARPRGGLLLVPVVLLVSGEAQAGFEPVGLDPCVVRGCLAQVDDEVS